MDSYDEFGNYIGPEFEDDDDEEENQFQDEINNQNALISRDLDDENGIFIYWYVQYMG